MKLGKVIGQITATRKDGNMDGLKLAVVRYLNEKLEETSKSAVCIDTVKANSGDIVLLCSSSSARFTKLTRYVATDNSIVGIVDIISSKKNDIYNRDKQLDKIVKD